MFSCRNNNNNKLYTKNVGSNIFCKFQLFICLVTVILSYTLWHIYVWSLWEIPWSKNMYREKNTPLTDKYVGPKTNKAKKEAFQHTNYFPVLI